MKEEVKLTKYNKNNDYSYTFGIFPTFELVKYRAERVIKIILSSKLKISEDVKNLLNLCEKKNIRIEYDDRVINRVADKENCFVLGVFEKYETKFDITDRNLVLFNPSDMGNMGTIMRTMLGFGINNLIIINPAVDHFNPKVIRASMGAIFSLNILEFDSIGSYLERSKNKKYFFMLKGNNILGKFEIKDKKYDLIFGNEASGLPENLLNYDESVVIKHTNKIDSLNLPISIGIALYEFTKNWY